MNSATNNNSKGCLSGCSCFILLTIIVLMIIDFVKISDYNDLQAQIDRYAYSSYYYSCYQVCGYSYSYQKNGYCCVYYDYSYCLSKSGCISTIVNNLRYQQTDISSAITALSIISGLLFVIFLILLCQSCKKPETNTIRNPLLNNQDLWNNINRSQKSSQPATRRIDTGYESFAYVDQENTCCICLEQFNNQKAILLKCGHIFHSACIRDWAVKQQNCPVCRSSQ